MARVLCTLENASTEISGVKFSVTDVGMLSEEISDALAAEWATIPGFELVELGEEVAAPAPPPKPVPAVRRKPAAAVAPAPAPAEPPVVAAEAPPAEESF